MQGIRIYHMPACRMVSSGRGMFGDGVLEAFSEWFERDPDRAEMGNIITPPEAVEALGYEQMDYYMPVRLK